jgi:glycosyltransferase involved in cell wall biosynthesis
MGIAERILVPDNKVLTAVALLPHIRKVIERTHPAAIITSSPPPSIHLVGYFMRKCYGVRWLADYRDAWIPHPQGARESHGHARIDRRMERAFAESADRTVVVSDGHLEALRRRYRSAEGRFSHIPNGYEEEVFEVARPRASRSQVFRIGYCGTLNHLTYVPGMLETLVDISASRAISLDICGVVSSDLKALISRIDPDERVIHLSGYRPHAQAVEFKMNCDANLITLAPGPDMQMTIPGKAYETLRVPKPVIGVLPRGGAAWRLLSRFDHVRLVDASDTAAMRSEVARLIDMEPSNIGLRAGIEEFSWNSLASRFDELLKEISS